MRTCHRRRPWRQSILLPGITFLLAAGPLMAGAAVPSGSAAALANQPKDEAKGRGRLTDARAVAGKLRELRELQNRTSQALRKKNYAEAASLLEAILQLADELERSASLSPAQRRQVEATRTYAHRMQEKYRDLLPSRSERAAEKGTGPARATVSFVRDVAPILVRNCLRCHGDQNPRSGFSLYTYKRMLQGGKRGNDVVPGKPEESLLILLVQGKEQPRMPPGGSGPLRPDLIEKLVTWVREGAEFDGTDSMGYETPLPELVPTEEDLLRERVASLNDNELAAYRGKLVGEWWALSHPRAALQQFATTHFLLVGALEVEQLRELGEAAEKVLEQLRRDLPSASPPTWRGGLTILVCTRGGYAELVRSVEEREALPGSYGHYRARVDLPYVAIAIPEGSTELTLRGVLAEVLAGAYVSEAYPQAPEWLRQAMGRAIAYRFDRQATFYRKLLREVAAQAPFSNGQVYALLAGKLSFEEAGRIGFALIEALSRSPQGTKGIQALLATLSNPAEQARIVQQGVDGPLVARLTVVLNQMATRVASW
jgi:hypothetical protein